MNNNYGLDKSDIAKIIKKRLDENADLLIGVDDPEVNELINILVEAVAEAIQLNNKQMTLDIDEELDKSSKKGGLVDNFGRSIFGRHN